MQYITLETTTYLPDDERLGVHNSRLDDLLGREHAPCDGVNVTGADISNEVPPRIDGHVSDRGRRLQPRL